MILHSHPFISHLLFFLLASAWQGSRAFLINPSRSRSASGSEDVDSATNPQYQSGLVSRQFCRTDLSLFNRKKAEASSDTIQDDKPIELDIILFGVGDLRTDDHAGLYEALTARSQSEERQRQILPLVILDDNSLSKIPGVVSHTVDTANMLVAALQDLQESLYEKLQLDLQVISTDKPLAQALMEIVDQDVKRTISHELASVKIHVQDLGPADNAMGYGPYSQFSQEKDKLPESIELVPWTCSLRSQPWQKIASLPDRYPEFVSQFANKEQPKKPLSLDNLQEKVPTSQLLKEYINIPSSEELVKRISSKLQLDADMVQAEINTGMFESHWGGLDAASCSESVVLQTLKTYVEECQEDDVQWVQHPQFTARSIAPRNPRSLEHAIFSWMVRGKGDSPFAKSDNLLAGESMTRYLAAPLLLGTVSPRRIWHLSQKQFGLFFQSPLQTLVEGREWHTLLAAKNIETRPEYQQSTENDDATETLGKTSYGYWRWHGFLCRYAQTPLSSKKDNPTSNKEGVLFFHGFGASGAQWNKAMTELSKIVSNDATFNENMEGLAPDLLGFGQCEKPAISYSIYVWDSQCTDFIKEIAVAQNKWQSYIVGGNSIGGFSAASTSANERATVDSSSVSSSGAPGTGKCQGVVLMNPAGPVLSRDDIEEKSYAGSLLSVAQASAIDALPSCSPFPRPVARAFGNGLLAYLRPRIQSICQNLYPTNPSAVDDDLCANIERDSLDPGAVAVMISGSKLPAPRTMNEMLKADFGAATLNEKGSPEEVSFDGPVLVATGVLDPLNDARGRSEGLAALRDGIVFDPINAGHCPHDELPKDVATSIAKWMTTSVRVKNAAAIKMPTSTSATP